MRMMSLRFFSKLLIMRSVFASFHTIIKHSSYFIFHLIYIDFLQKGAMDPLTRQPMGDRLKIFHSNGYYKTFTATAAVIFYFFACLIAFLPL